MDEFWSTTGSTVYLLINITLVVGRFISGSKGKMFTSVQNLENKQFKLR